jgi:hypothetical protein
MMIKGIPGNRDTLFVFYAKTETETEVAKSTSFTISEWV